MMGKIKYIASTLVALIFILSACEREEYEINPTDGGAIELSANLVTPVARGVQTEDIADVTSMGVMGIYDDQYSASIKDIFLNQEMTQVTTGVWSYSPTIYWSKNSGDEYSFAIYSPYLVDGVNNANGLTLSDADSYENATISYEATTANITNQPDLLVAGHTMMRGTGLPKKVGMEFKHALTSISFTGFGLGQKVTKIKLSNIVTKGSFRLSDVDASGVSAWTLEPATGVLELTDANGFEVNMDADGKLMINEKGYLMMIPQNFDSSSAAKLTVTINGEDRVTSLAGKDWGAGVDLSKELKISLRLEDFDDVTPDIVSATAATKDPNIWLPTYITTGESATRYMPTTWDITNKDSDTDLSRIGRLAIDLFTALRSDRLDGILDGTAGGFVTEDISAVPFGFRGDITMAGRETVTVNMDDIKDLSGTAWVSTYYEDDVRIPLVGKVSMKSLTDLGAATFTFCEHLTYLDAPYLTDILDQQFRRCYRLQSIGSEVNNAMTGRAELRLTQVGHFAFDYCINFAENTDIILDFTNYDSVDDYIPNLDDEGANINSDDIGSHAFRFTPIESITDKNGVVDVIGMNAFDNCTSLKSADIPNVAGIKSHAFIHCTSLEEFIAPQAVGVGDYAFQECTNIKKVVLSSVDSIHEHTFHNCINLKTLDISSAIFIGEYALSECHSLVDINFSKIKEIDQFAFQGCTSLFPATSPAGTVHAPELEILGNNAFEDCISILYVDMDEILTIGESAFNGCSSLLTFEAAKTQTLGANAFEGCTQLETAILPSVKAIPAGAFRLCHSLKTVNVGAEMIAIGEGAFDECVSYESFTADNVRTLGVGAFVDCGDLHTVSLKSMNEIPGSSFKNCVSLVNVNIPNAEIVGDAAFSGCETLKKVSLEHATTIGMSAFENCELLTSIGSMAKVKTIGDKAFYGSGIAGDVVLNELTALTGYNTFKETKITSFIAPNLTNIGPAWNGNFQYCTELKTVEINGVTAISDAFTGSNNIETLKVNSLVDATDLINGLPNLVTLEANAATSFPAWTTLTNLTSVSAKSLTSITQANFNGWCGKLAYLNLAGLTNIASYSFNGLGAAVAVQLIIGTESSELTLDKAAFDWSTPSNIDLHIGQLDSSKCNYTVAGNKLTITAEGSTVDVYFKSITVE